MTQRSEPDDEAETNAIIAEQNDRFRTTWGADFTVPGQIVLTRGVTDLSPAAKAIIMQRVQQFSEFTEDNDLTATTPSEPLSSRSQGTATTSSGKSISTIKTTAWAAVTPPM